MVGWLTPPPSAAKTDEVLREERRQKVAQLLRQGLLRSERVRQAMLAVSREEFVPAAYRDHTYEEVPLVLPGRAATISCPHSYPLFYEALGLEAGHRFLEVGLGSGYGAALAREIVGPSGLVISIEIDPDTFAWASANLDRAGYPDVVRVLGDGGLGWPAQAPYDRICVTAACPQVPAPLLDQLREGGRLIAPVKHGARQELTLIEKTASGMHATVICDVLYVDLQGAYGVHAQALSVSRRPALVVTCLSHEGGRGTRRALRRALPGARVHGSGFRGVLCVDAEGAPLAIAGQVLGACGLKVGRVTAVLAEVPSERAALVRGAAALAEKQVGRGRSFAFRVHKRGRHGYLEPTPVLEADVGAAIRKALVERDGVVPRVDLTQPDVLIGAEVLGPTTLLGVVGARPAPPTPARLVLHVDLDQFIVAVELLRRPELRGRAVVVGDEGDLTRRGVVAGASYEARRFGVHSAMPLRRAASRCSDLVCLPLDIERYQEASAAVMGTLRSFPAVAVEVAGWDEAFLEVDTEDPERLAREVRAAVEARTGLSCSVGIGDNKLQAKTATGLAKPGGIARLTTASWPVLIGQRSPEEIPGIGRKTARRLAGMAIHTVRELADADASTLAGSFGPVAGPRLRALARGEDDAPVRGEPRRARSRGREVTFQHDLEDPAAIRAVIRRLAANVASEVTAEGRPAVRVVVKIRFAPFETHTHGVTLKAMRPSSLERAALRALGSFDLDRPVRLVGVRAELEPA